MRNTADVLIIDDSDLARAAMREALAGSGLRVVELPSPIGATSAILRTGVGVVVIDINMPSMRGDKLAALFRSSDRFEQLKIVLASGEDAGLLSQLAKDVRADAVISKSAGPEELVRIVRTLMGAGR